MDDETAKHLWALRKMNEALLDGLKAAIFVLEKEEELRKKDRLPFLEFQLCLLK